MGLIGVLVFRGGDLIRYTYEPSRKNDFLCAYLIGLTIICACNGVRRAVWFEIDSDNSNYGHTIPQYNN